MGKNPCFLFYPSDWDRDMGYHPLEIGGAWMLMLCSLFWEGGSASKTLQEWAKIIRENPKKTEKILDYLAQKSICDLLNQNGIITITARRMVRDIKIREIRKLAGSKGGNPLLIPSNKEVGLLNQNGKQNASKNQPPSVSVSVSVSNHKQKEAKKMVFLLPDWIKKETWEAYREMRQRKRAPLTDRASALIIKELEKLKNQGNPPEDVLNQSIMKSWTGVFPISRGGDGDGNRSGNYRGSGAPYPQTGRGQDDRSRGLGIPKEYKPEHIPPISEEDRERNLERVKSIIDG